LTRRAKQAHDGIIGRNGIKIATSSKAAICFHD
jgi:hypothetical protein